MTAELAGEVQQGEEPGQLSAAPQTSGTAS